MYISVHAYNSEILWIQVGWHEFKDKTCHTVDCVSWNYVHTNIAAAVAELNAMNLIQYNVHILLLYEWLHVQSAHDSVIE